MRSPQRNLGQPRIAGDRFDLPVRKGQVKRLSFPFGSTGTRQLLQLHAPAAVRLFLPCGLTLQGLHSRYPFVVGDAPMAWWHWFGKTPAFRNDLRRSPKRKKRLAFEPLEERAT